LAAELRADIVHSVSDTGGHLSSSLGVVELSVALHHVFDTPDDKIIWDVGHQVELFLCFIFELVISIENFVGKIESSSRRKFCCNKISVF